VGDIVGQRAQVLQQRAQAMQRLEYPPNEHFLAG
jgi:hypothetical protein